MDEIKCLIVDDEPIARDIIKSYCAHLPYLNVLASVGNVMDARTLLFQQKTDLLFLDINMPVMDGVTFLRTLKNPPQIIFTTAYREFAIDAFELSACDYLLKPFSLERFLQAIDKAAERLRPLPKDSPDDVRTEDFLFLKSDGKIFKIHHLELLYAEASGNYTKVVTTSQTLMPAMSFSSFEELLPKTTFLRIHRSFIVNKTKIDHIEGNRLFINNKEIPIGSNYREGFLKEIGLGS